jgi:polyphosphate kinase
MRRQTARNGAGNPNGGSAAGSTPVAVAAPGAAAKEAPTSSPATVPSAPSTAGERPPQRPLCAPELFLNRELTWLEFNRRVLAEAQDERTPLLERIKFVAILGSNLDEFFMKRIGGLKRQVGAGVPYLTPDGRTPQQQIEECYAVVRDIEAQRDTLLPVLFKELQVHGIAVLPYADLTAEEQRLLRDHYVENIYPLVTPQAVDPAHPFPFISSLSLNLLITLRYTDEEEIHLARVKLPVGSGIPRFVRIGAARRFVLLEEVVSNNLDLLFPQMVIDRCELFHVTRNANVQRSEDQADDLLAMIESELRDRMFTPIVRAVVAEDMEPAHRGMMAAELGLDEARDVFLTCGLMATRDLFELVALNEPALHDPPHQPVDHAKLTGTRNIFHTIRDAGSIFLQHPYESFSTSVERFLREASEDPKVRAIKMCLYRTSADTKVIDYLIDAALNGKRVAVVVELKARFDEAANIRWASRMEEVGIHVTYGVVGLKTHAKVVLVVRQDYSGLRRYAHIGTGNYHAGTARLYCDLGLLTCDDAIGRDLTELFNYLTTGYTPKRNYQKILPAPKLLKRSLLDKIEREIAGHSLDSPGLIQIKVNALEDADLTCALYNASQAGVHVDLIVRDTCRLRPGIPAVSENIRVISIVGRFLEHSRVYFFRNGGSSEYYIGSADAMQRSFEHRVEVLVPVEDPNHQAELRTILDAQLADQRNGWDMQADGTYVQRQPSDPSAKGSQRLLVELADGRLKAAKRLKRRKPKGITGRNLRN